MKIWQIDVLIYFERFHLSLEVVLDGHGEEEKVVVVVVVVLDDDGEMEEREEKEVKKVIEE